jgi:hypothetical protein
MAALCQSAFSPIVVQFINLFRISFAIARFDALAYIPSLAPAFLLLALVLPAHLLARSVPVVQVASQLMQEGLGSVSDRSQAGIGHKLGFTLSHAPPPLRHPRHHAPASHARSPG